MPAIREQVRSCGEPTKWRVFADFTEKGHKGWLDICRAEWLEPVLCLSSGAGKNSTDMAMVVEAMDILHNQPPDGIVIVSNDRDFAPLAKRLRASPLEVHGIGTKQTSAAMRDCYTTFTSLKQQPKVGAPISQAITKSKPVSADEPFRKAVEDLLPEAGLTLSALGKLLREKYAQISAKYGSGKLKKALILSERFVIEKDKVRRKTA